MLELGYYILILESFHTGTSCWGYHYLCQLVVAAEILVLFGCAIEVAQL
jgi:hypothetical protein